MQSKKITKSAFLNTKSKKNINALTLAVASCLVYSASNAAGLGKLSVLSALGEPLRAEIELTSVAKGDIGSLVPKLASYSEFQQAQIDYNQTLSSLRFAVEERGPKHVVVVTSKQAINDPFVELLVELDSANGRLIREYGLLLEPAEMQANHAIARVDNDAVMVKAQDKITLPSTVSTRKQFNSASSNASQKNTGYYKIKSGDTLSAIANQFKYQGISLEQMLVAIQQNNPSAFINNNMNLIRSGDMLMIPDVSEVQRVDHSEARKVIAAHSADFNAYRNRLADQVAEMSPEESVETKKIDSGKITAKVTELSSPENEAKDKLQLSKADVKELDDLLTLEEENIAQQIELQTASERIKELEQNTANLKKILDLQNETAPSLASTDTPSVSSIFPVIGTTASIDKPSQVDQPSKGVVPTVAPEQGKAIDWFRYWPAALWGGVLLVLLGIARIYLIKRKKANTKVKKQLDDRSDSVQVISAIAASRRANLLPRSARFDEGQTVDNVEHEVDDRVDSLLHQDFVSPASLEEIMEIDQAVDPLTQADALIAQGRFQQAEELLNEALRVEPNRHLLRVKLLEIYTHLKDTHNFEIMARKVYEMTGGKGGDWAKVMVLGAIVDPHIVSSIKDQVAMSALKNEIDARSSVFDFALKAEAANEDVIQEDVIQEEVIQEEVVQTPSQQLAPESEDTLGFDSQITTLDQERLVQVETRPSWSEKTVTLESQTQNVNLASADQTFIDIDFSGIDLDLPKISADADQNELSAHFSNKKLEKILAASPEEILTKLDLASAYRQIGDRDGARELLKEVLQAGNQEQVVTAKTMMSELA